MADNPYYIEYGQGPAKPADSKDQELDEYGLTNPNLHRRTDILDPPQSPEIVPRQYQFGIYGVHSYKYRRITIHDEESETSEIP